LNAERRTQNEMHYLVATAPTEYDFHALARVMCEEMRHGYQMSYLLCSHCG